MVLVVMVTSIANEYTCWTITCFFPLIGIFLHLCEVSMIVNIFDLSHPKRLHLKGPTAALVALPAVKFCNFNFTVECSDGVGRPSFQHDGRNTVLVQWMGRVLAAVYKQRTHLRRHRNILHTGTVSAADEPDV